MVSASHDFRKTAKNSPDKYVDTRKRPRDKIEKDIDNWLQKPAEKPVTRKIPSVSSIKTSKSKRVKENKNLEKSPEISQNLSRVVLAQNVRHVNACESCDNMQPQKSGKERAFFIFQWNRLNSHFSALAGAGDAKDEPEQPEEPTEIEFSDDHFFKIWLAVFSVLVAVVSIFFATMVLFNITIFEDTSDASPAIEESGFEKLISRIFNFTWKKKPIKF